MWLLAWTVHLALSGTGVGSGIILQVIILYTYYSVIPKHIFTYLSFLALSALPIPVLSMRYNYFLFYILRV